MKWMTTTSADLSEMKKWMTATSSSSGKISSALPEMINNTEQTTNEENDTEKNQVTTTTTTTTTTSRKDLSEMMKWMTTSSRKKITKAEEERDTVTTTTTTNNDEESCDTTTEKNQFSSSSSLLSKMWNQRKSSSGKSTAPSVTADDTHEPDIYHQDASAPVVETTTTEATEPPKPLWISLWGSRNSIFTTSNAANEAASATPVEETDNVEVEVADDNGTIRVHDITTTKKFHKSLLPRPRREPLAADETSVYEEALEMLTASLLIYIFADLREMARDGTISSKDLLDDPISIPQVMRAIQEHQDALAQRQIHPEEVGQKLTSLKEIHDRHHHHQQQKQSKKSNTNNHFWRIQNILQGGAVSSETATALTQQVKQSVLAHFVDERTTQGVVYGIAVNHLRKRITVIFRGSVTTQDFMTDARSGQKNLENPVKEIIMDASSSSDHNNNHGTSSPKNIRVHNGFYQYLFRKDKEGKIRIRHILDDAKKLLKENPGYRFYCTGHSLGGACATLCGFYAALEDEIVRNGPVVVVSVASPQVGDHQFCDAFYGLEKLHRLQHLRISNREDMISHLPFLTIKATAFSPLLSAILGAGNLYKHCGFHLEFKSLEIPSEEERNDDDDDGNDEEKTMTTHYSLCHPKGARECGGGVAEASYSEEFKRAIESAKLLVESLRPVAKRDFDVLLKHHSCREYEARLMAAEDYLSTISLDQLYQDESLMGGASSL